jgi:hypothetical protein
MVCPFMEDDVNGCPYSPARQVLCWVRWWLSLRSRLLGTQTDMRCGECIRRRLRYLKDALRPTEANREVPQ